MNKRLNNIKENARTLKGHTTRVVLNKAWINVIDELCDEVASARAIMEKFVNKVDSGMARSKETYKEMKEWLDD